MISAMLPSNMIDARANGGNFLGCLGKPRRRVCAQTSAADRTEEAANVPDDLDGMAIAITLSVFGQTDWRLPLPAWVVRFVVQLPGALDEVQPCDQGFDLLATAPFNDDEVALHRTTRPRETVVHADGVAS